jgi:hypothetical protein
MKLATLLPRGDDLRTAARLARAYEDAGDMGYIRDRLAAFRDQGVTVLQVEPVGEDPLGDLRRLRALLDT